MERRIRRKILCYVGMLFAATLLFALSAQKAFAAQAPGTYTVTVTPFYRDPVTGEVEDPGNNEAIGQGMTENLCGSTGLLEVEENGTAYLTVRYYLDPFIGNVTFEERTSGSSSWSALSYTEMQSQSGNSSATDIHEKYGFTDYRMRITDITSTFRGGAYVDPMGRSVIYYFQPSHPVEGSGDFITSLRPTEPETEALPQETEAREELPAPEEEFVYEEETFSISEAEPETIHSQEASINGSGNVDDPVTGIPEKPSTGSELTVASTVSSDTRSYDNEDYHLKTSYDLAAVSLREARLLTAPMLEDAVGITGMTSDTDWEDLTSEGSVTWSNNQMVMVLLLGISGILLLRFAYVAVLQSRRQAAAEKKTEDRNGEREK